MSAFPDSQVDLPAAHATGLSPAQYAVLAVAVAVLGLTTIWPPLVTLWTLWTNDALKSIGMIIPLVSLVLIVRAWRSLGWQANGVWWGLPLLLVTIAAVVAQQRAVLLLVVSPGWATIFPPASLVLLTYGAAVVLLLGGVRLFRAALFPIVLLWFANPVPHAFNLWIDLPLQAISAHIARAFAMHLGQHLTPDNLRLMFTPDFGMFIAPGCNGIRGSVTMGFIALIAGYVYRFRWYVNALVVIAAILLGYVFNLARLCLLVLYYVVALHFTSLQNKAKNADYLIGAALFLVATFLLFTVIHRLRGPVDRSPLPAAVTPQRAPAPAKRYAQLAVLATIALFGCVGLARAVESARANPAVDAAQLQFPHRIGTYTLARSWNETLITGPVAYVWAQYVPADGGTPVAVGVSPVLGWHDPLLCHTIRGEHTLWQGQFTTPTADSVSINFSSAFYNDGVTQLLEASTQCSIGSCGEFATQRTHLGFVYSRPDPNPLLSHAQRPVPVLLRAETTNMDLSADAARQQLTQDLRTFLASASLDDLTRPYSR